MRLLAVASLVAVAGASTASAAAARTPGAVAHRRVAHPVGGDAAVLYSQNDNPGLNGVNSQNFEASFDAFDDEGADDFTVPTGVKWNVKEVDVSGFYFNGAGPAVSENVTFYRDATGLPGALVKAVNDVVGLDDGTGNLKIKVGKVKLRPGTYWVSVQANMDFNSGGQWAWFDRTVQNGSPAAWQNPGDGFGSGCTAWANMNTCIGLSGEPDFMFALKGALV